VSQVRTVQRRRGVVRTRQRGTLALQTVPRGGVQAGAGGVSQDGSGPSLPGIARGPRSVRRH
jgi:hypothetical protein